MASEASGMSAIAERYATALFDLAEDGTALDRVAKDLRELKAMIEASETLRRFIRSPLLGREDQAKGILAVLGEAKAHDLTRRFIGVVARNRRLFAVPAMIDAYLAILAESRGEVAAQVVSAVKLTAAQVTAITNALKTAVGGNVVVDAAVDADLIGGLVVRVGSRMIDTSLRTKLQRMRLAMKGAG